MLSGSLIAGALPDPVEEGDELGALGGGQRVRGDGQGGVEPLVGVALVDQRRVDVEDHALDRVRASAIRGVRHSCGQPSCSMSGAHGPSNSLAAVTTDGADAAARRPGRRPARADADPAREARALAARGMEPYAIGLPITATIADVRAAHPDLPDGHRHRRQGRHRRPGDLLAQHRQACFATLRAGDGAEIQAMISLANVGEEQLARLEGPRRPRRPRVRRRARSSRPSAASSPSWPTSGAWRPRRCVRCPWRTSRSTRRPASGSATSTSSCGPRRSRSPAPASPSCSSIRQSLTRRGYPRDRDADAADDARRRDGAAVRHPLQRLRHRRVPAHRAGAVPQARRRRRARAGLRGQPQLPQRGRRSHALAGVHDARVLPGVRRLPGHGDDHAGDLSRRPRWRPAGRSS